MSAIYNLGFLGQPADDVEAKLRETLGRMVGEFGLTLGVEVGLSGPAFAPKPGMAAAALHFGFPGAKDTPELTRLVRQEVPIIPVVSRLTQFGVETPPGLRHLNGLDLESQDEDYTGLAAALLECVGLLPRRRRVFVSYRRTESRMAAVQLFEELSGFCALPVRSNTPEPNTDQCRANPTRPASRNSSRSCRSSTVVMLRLSRR